MSARIRNQQCTLSELEETDILLKVEIPQSVLVSVDSLMYGTIDDGSASHCEQIIKGRTTAVTAAAESAAAIACLRVWVDDGSASRCKQTIRGRATAVTTTVVSAVATACSRVWVPKGKVKQSGYKQKGVGRLHIESDTVEVLAQLWRVAKAWNSHCLDFSGRNSG